MYKQPRIKREKKLCELGMKCSDPKCKRKHPGCKLGTKCKNPTCGFMHPDGHRYTKKSSLRREKLKQAPSASVDMCWKRHKCTDPLCPKAHPSCRNDSSCSNPKCGFLHSDGRRYTGPAIEYRHNTHPNYTPTQGSTTSGPPLENSVSRNSSLDEMCFVGKDSFTSNELCCSIESTPCKYEESVKLFKIGKLVSAYGHITDIDQNKNYAMIEPKLYCFTKHPEFHTAAIESGSVIRYDFKDKHSKQHFPFQSLIVGDEVKFKVYLNHDYELAVCDIKIKKMKLEDRSCKSLVSMVEYALNDKMNINEIVLTQILNLKLASNIVVGALILKTYHVWTDCSQIIRARQFYSLFKKTSFLLPHGSFCSQIPNLSQIELSAARDMLGSMCMLQIDDASVLIYPATLLAYKLGNTGISLLSGMLEALVPKKQDYQSNYCWWQLPSIPLKNDITCTDAYGTTDIKALPSVLLGTPYKSVEEYISTYMRLHRADCFAMFLSHLKKNVCRNEKGEQRVVDSEAEFVICQGLSVCGIHVSVSTGELDVQLGCTIEDEHQIRHSTFALTNMVCISLQGDFNDEQLIWALVSAPPDTTLVYNERRRIVFGIRFCSKINKLLDHQLLEMIKKYQSTARIIENPVSFISYEPVLDAMRSLWRPGKPITLPFAETLVYGENISTNSKSFLKVGNDLRIPDDLDQFQLEAYHHVAENKLSLIQGPPGCGKSYLCSRLCRIFSEITGSILVVTFKNHALDEIVNGIAELYGENGLEKIIRIGNSKKISKRIKHRSLQAILANKDVIGNTTDPKLTELYKHVSQCNKTCKQLQKEIKLTSVNFAEATGALGVYTLCRILGWECEYTKCSFSEDPPENRERVDFFLSEWANLATDELKEESTQYWKHFNSKNLNDLELEQQQWSIERQQKQDFVSDWEGFSEVHPHSLMGIMIAFGLSNSELLLMPDFDMSSLLTWGVESRKMFLLSVFRFEYSQLTNSFSDLAGRIAPMQEDKRAHRLKIESKALKSVPIIASTVLGVLLNMDAIAATKPKALVLEESGEIPEAALIAILRMPSLKRCVMIGDHQQLRPSTNSYDLRVHKNLDVSCFERLVHLKVKISTLKTQNRMRKDVLLPVLQHYPGIVSNEMVVQGIPSVDWLVSPLFWWICEDRGIKQHASWYNEEQGHRATELASFLVDQGSAEQEKITILVPYSSQLFYTRMLLRQRQKTNIIVSTIDQYQGDENDVIILCMVRCDHENPTKLGFLGETNRMIVATSRQRKALIMIGSQTCFSTNGSWKTLQDALRHPVKCGDDLNHARIGQNLPICCPRHKKTLFIPNSKLFPSSGCGEGCGAKLQSCCHKCTLKCHPITIEHGKCKVMVEHTHSDCLHVFQYQCHAIPTYCPQELQVTLPKCGHKQKLTCGKLKSIDINKMKCNKTCRIKLPCSHEIWLRCGSSTDGYISEDLNACPTCLIQSIDMEEEHCVISKFVERCDSLTKKSPNGSENHLSITREQLKLITDVVERENLCDTNSIEQLKIALKRAKLPIKLFASSIPNPNAWDPHISTDEKRLTLEKFSADQGMWRVLLQESGLEVPSTWQKHPLALLAGLSLTCIENRTTWRIKEKTNAEIFFERLQVLHKSSIKSSLDLITVVKQAGNSLYKALSENVASAEKWYNAGETQLANVITSRLLAAPLCADHNNKDVDEMGKYMFDVSKVRQQISNAILHKETYQHRREMWNFPSVVSGNIHSPPYEEVKHDFCIDRL